MTTFSFKTLHKDGACLVLADSFDLSKLIDGAEVHTWAFTNKERNTGTLLRTNDAVAAFGLSLDKNGKPNINAYNIAFAECYMQVHCKEWSKDAKTYPAPFTDETIEAECTPEVLQEYVKRCFPAIDWDSLVKKDQPSGEGQASLTPSPSESPMSPS